MGAQHKPSHSRTARRLPAAAAPAVAGVAAAICFAPQALAATAAPSAPSTPQAFTSAGRHATIDALEYLAEPQQAAAALLARSKSQVPAQATTYTVKEGDTLSSIAGHVYNQRAAWPVIYYANRGTIRWANEITPGQVLKIPAKPARLPGAPGQSGPVAQPAPAGYALTSAPVASSSYSGGGGFQSCVIARESGGNSQVMNATGHYGLYQFSESTWVAYGGSAGDFGNASVAEQNRVFQTAVARGGQSNWSAYDGC